MPGKRWSACELALARRQLEFPGFVPLIGARSYKAISVQLTRLRSPESRKVRRKPGAFRAAVRDYCAAHAVPDPAVAAALGTTHQEVWKARKALAVPDYRTRLWASAWHSVASDAKYVEYAKRLAGQWGRRAPHLADEFESAAMLGLVKAARGWDAGRGPFSAYFVLHVRSELSDVWAKRLPLGYRYRHRGRDCPGTVSLAGYHPSGDDLDVSDDRRPPGGVPGR